MALSFDDGPDPEVTPGVLELLARYEIRAAFFVVGQRAEAYPELIREILAQGHEVGNHTWHHDTLLAFKGRQSWLQEVEGGQRILAALGIHARAFRPPVGIATPAMAWVLKRLGLACITFSLRGLDAGNRRLKGLGQRLLGRVKPGDLILLHDVKPPSASVETLLHELDLLFRGMREQGLRVVRPSVLLGIQVMESRP